MIEFLAGVLVGALAVGGGIALLLVGCGIAETEPSGDDDRLSVTRFRHEAGQLAKDSERMIRIQDAEMERRRRAEGA